MATKEQLHKLIDALPDTPETERRLDVAERDLIPSGPGDPGQEPDVVGRPAGWGIMSNGEPTPNVVAAVRRVRDEH